MRVMLINCVYNKGSTGKIVADLRNELSMHNVECFVGYGRGESTTDNQVIKTASEITSKAYNLLSRFTGVQFGGQLMATKRLIRTIEEIKPDVIHLHCINGFFVNIYSLLQYLKENDIPTVLTLHAEFMYTGGCGYALDCQKWLNEEGCGSCPQLREATGSYFLDRTAYCWKKMKEAFDGFDKLRVVSVSPWLMQRAQQSVILKDKKHSCVFNGIDHNVFCYRPNKQAKYEDGLANQKTALYVTAAFSKFKGADYLLELCDRMPEITFVVVGNKEPITNQKKNLRVIGRLENQSELAKLYSMADVTLLLSKRETFSMVCAESLCCGTPVVGFKAGAPETICLPEYSSFCDYGDVEALCSNITDAVNKAYDKRDISDQACAKYAKSQMTKE